MNEPRAARGDWLTRDAGSDEHGRHARQEKQVEHVRDEHREREEVPQNALLQFVLLCFCVSTYSVMPERAGHGAGAGEPLEERGAPCVRAAAPERLPSRAERACCSPPRGDQRASRRARRHWPFHLARETGRHSQGQGVGRDRGAKRVEIVPTATTRQIVGGCERPRSVCSGRPRSGVSVGPVWTVTTGERPR